jgi:tRNA threonylcarbamoyladenosine biosynthesis protein TsaB
VAHPQRSEQAQDHLVNRISGITLAIDAATYEGSVAVLRDGVIVAERVVAMRGETEERLMPAVHDAVAAAGISVNAISRVVCGEGPGSFTSLRIAGSIAKGIAFGNGVPLFAVSSLALVVAGARDLAPGRYLAVLDAMRGERFTAPFHRDASGIVTPMGSVSRVAQADVARTAEHLEATAIGPLERVVAAPLARGVAAMLAAVTGSGAVDIDSWEPAYGRLAEAQVRWEAAHGRPLTA